MAVEVLVPPLGTNVDTLILSAWLIEEGATVEAGQPLFSVETDKATLEVEAPSAGVLADVTARAGDEVAVLSRIAYLLEPGEPLPSGELPARANRATTYGTTQAVVPALSREPSSDRVFVSPRARRLAEAEGVVWSTLAGTGPEGAVIERDVRGALGTAAPSQRHQYSHSLPFIGTRAVIAERMLASATSTAPVTLTTEVDATELVEARLRMNGSNLRVSYNDLLTWLLGRALTEHPLLNTRLDGDTLRYGGPIHIGFAVDTERGLLVPVVRDVQRKSLIEIAAESATLIGDARNGVAAPEALRGSTLTLTNLGAFGIDAFTPLPNLPEGAILGVGRIRPAPAVVDGHLCVRQQVWLSLTFDHRLLDGAPAARFLQRFSEMMQDRELMESA